MVQALVKSGTTKSRKRSKIIPVDSLLDMFRSWPANDLLDIKRLRLKVLTLLALVLMLRPSDVAPKSQAFNPRSLSTTPVFFTTEDIVYKDDGGATVWIHGNKNDTDRAGFQVDLVPSSDPLVDPIQALRSYIDKTNKYRPTGGPVFLALRKPYNPISASTVAKVLDEALQLANLYPKFSAKDFRPTGATFQIECGVDPEIVMKIGRWKTRSVFFEHYVHAKVPSTFTDNVLI